MTSYDESFEYGVPDSRNIIDEDIVGPERDGRHEGSVSARNVVPAVENIEEAGSIEESLKEKYLEGNTRDETQEEEYYVETDQGDPFSNPITGSRNDLLL